MWADECFGGVWWHRQIDTPKDAIKAMLATMLDINQHTFTNKAGDCLGGRRVIQGSGRVPLL